MVFGGKLGVVGIVSSSGGLCKGSRVGGGEHKQPTSTRGARGADRDACATKGSAGWEARA